MVNARRPRERAPGFTSIELEEVEALKPPSISKASPALKAALLVVAKRMQGGFIPLKEACRIYGIRPRSLLKALNLLKRMGYYCKPSYDGLINYVLNSLYILGEERAELFKQAKELLSKLGPKALKANMLSLTAAAIYLADKVVGLGWLSMKQIAEAIGVSEASIRRAKKVLEELLRGGLG